MVESTQQPPPEAEKAAPLPCPFCGSDAKEKELKTFGEFYVSCSKPCDACPEVTATERDDAVKIWNTRPAELALAKALEDLLETVAEARSCGLSFASPELEASCRAALAQHAGRRQG